MKLSEKSVFRLTVFIPVISVVFLATVLTYSIISYQHDFLDKEFEKEKVEYINSQKQLIKNEVNKVFELITYKDKISQLRLQKKITTQMDAYYNLVLSIYSQNRKKPKSEIVKIIKETLRDIRLGQNNGYINIFDLSGKGILLPLQSHYEGMSILGFRDQTNSKYIKEAILIAKEDGVGFFSNYEVKPGVEQNEEFYKLNYIKLFEPLGLVLSVGDFLDNIDIQIKSEILSRANEIRFGRKGYIYIVKKDGELIAHREPKLIGINAFKIKDINGKYYFKDSYYESKKHKEVFLEYVSRTNKDKKDMYNAKKLSFAKYNAYYDWAISAGVYLDDIENVIMAKKELNKKKFNDFVFYIVSIAVVLSIIVIFISFKLAVNIRRRFSTYQKEVLRKERELKNINDSLEESIKTELEKSRKKDAQLISQARFASLGEMIGNIAHQWRQPLSAISTISSGNLVQSQIGVLTTEDNQKGYNDIIKHVSFLSQTIEDFRNYLDKKDEDKKEFDINKTIEDILKIIEVAYRDNDISLELNLDRNSLNLFGSSSEISQVILNILNNAKDILVENKVQDKKVKIESYKNKAGQIVIKLCDNGGGVPENIKEKIFDPYFTTKHQSQGTGIGLYMSKDIIQNKYNGSLTVENINWNNESKEYLGACFEIVI